jgi:hypothetical protein
LGLFLQAGAVLRVVIRKSFTVMLVLIEGLVWFTVGFRMAEGTGGWGLWAIFRKKAL